MHRILFGDKGGDEDSSSPLFLNLFVKQFIGKIYNRLWIASVIRLYISIIPFKMPLYL